MPVTKDRIISKSKYKKTEIKTEIGEDFIASETDVTPVVDRAKRLSNEYKKGSLLGNTQKHHNHVAEIPAVIYYDMLRKLGQPSENPKAWKKWLNDPDNKAFRVGGGKL